MEYTVYACAQLIIIFAIFVVRLHLLDVHMFARSEQNIAEVRRRHFAHYSRYQIWYFSLHLYNSKSYIYMRLYFPNIHRMFRMYMYIY